MFAVCAHNAEGDGAAVYRWITLPAQITKPGVPQNPVVTSGNGQIKLSWEEPVNNGGAPVRYEVICDDIFGGASTGWIPASSDSEHTFTGLTSGNLYAVSVRAVNDVYEGDAADGQWVWLTPADSYAIAFPDANFRGEVLKLLNSIDGGSRTHLSKVNDDLALITAVEVINVANKDISDMTGIKYFVGLQALRCDDNGQLSELDVSKNLKLEYLDCGDNDLASLDISSNTALVTLRCNNNNLTELDISENTALEILDCQYNLLTELDVSNNIELRYLNCEYNYFETTDNIIGWETCENLTEFIFGTQYAKTESPAEIRLHEIRTAIQGYFDSLSDQEIPMTDDVNDLGLIWITNKEAFGGSALPECSRFEDETNDAYGEFAYSWHDGDGDSPAGYYIVYMFYHTDEGEFVEWYNSLLPQRSLFLDDYFASKKSQFLTHRDNYFASKKIQSSTRQNSD